MDREDIKDVSVDVCMLNDGTADSRLKPVLTNDLLLEIHTF